jgi:hypothetical protein
MRCKSRNPRKCEVLPKCPWKVLHYMAGAFLHDKEVWEAQERDLFFPGTHIVTQQALPSCSHFQLTSPFIHHFKYSTRFIFLQTETYLLSHPFNQTPGYQI